MKGPKTDPSSAFLALKLTWFQSQLLLVLSHSFLIPIIHFVPKPPYHSLTQYSLSVKNGSLNNLGRRLHRYLGHKKLSMSQSRNPFTATGRLSRGGDLLIYICSLPIITSSSSHFCPTFPDLNCEWFSDLCRPELGFCGWRRREGGGRGGRAAHRGCLPIAQGQFCRYSSADAASPMAHTE